MCLLSEDINAHSNRYENELITYLANTVRYGDTFPIYSKSLSSPSFNKNQFYLPMGHNRLIQDFNCIVPSHIQDKNFVCWQYTAQVIVDSLLSRTGKANFAEHFSNPSAIKAHILQNIKEKYEALKSNAEVVGLVSNYNLGMILKAYFDKMQEPGRRKNNQLLLIESVTHSMAFGLRIKGTKSERIYVIHFYEPGMSNTVVRFQTSDLSVIENQTLKPYLDGIKGETKSMHQWFYGESEFISIVYECNVTSLTPSSVKLKRKLAYFDSTPLLPAHIYFLLSDNFYVDLIELKSRLQKIGAKSQSRLIELLAVKDEDGVPGFYFTLDYCYARTINAYRELLLLISDEEVRMNLLDPRIPGGLSGIYRALKMNFTETIKAYVNLINLLPKNRHAEFVASLNLDNEEELLCKLNQALEDSYG